MSNHSFEIFDPKDYKRLLDLIAPSLAGIARNRLPSAEARPMIAIERSELPQTVLPPDFGHPRTWLPAKNNPTEVVRALPGEADFIPLESATQCTVALVQVMLKYPSVWCGDLVQDGVQPSIEPLAGPKKTLSGKLFMNKSGRNDADVEDDDSSDSEVITRRRECQLHKNHNDEYNDSEPGR